MRFSRIITITLLVILTRGGLALADVPASEPSAAAPQPPVMRSLEENELKDMLAAALQHDHVGARGELELTLARSWQPVTVPDGPLTLKVTELPTLGVTASFIVRFELLAGDAKLGTWQMPVTARIWRDVWVARTTLRRGLPVSETDRVRERRDVLALRDAWLGEEADDAKFELAENVPAGAPLLARHVRLRTLVKRGQVTEAIVRDGPMRVSLKVEVLEDGACGQQVRVRNVQSKREFRGKVEDEGTISVSL